MYNIPPVTGTGDSDTCSCSSHEFGIGSSLQAGIQIWIPLVREVRSSQSGSNCACGGVPNSELYSARAQDGPQDMERNEAGDRLSCARQHAWLLLNFFPFPVGHPEHEHCVSSPVLGKPIIHSNDLCAVVSSDS